MTQPALEVRVYDTLDSLSTLRTAWEQLLLEFPTATTFCTMDWLLPWWRAFGGGQQLKVLAFFDSTQRLVAIAPLSVTTRRVASGVKLKLLRLMGDGSQDSDNLDLPVRPGLEDRFARALLDFLESEGNSWDFAELNTLPVESPGGNALRQLLGEKKWVAVEQQIPASAIALPATWEEYGRLLSAKERGKIGLRTRRLEKKYEVRIRRCADEDEIDSLLQALYQLHGKHWQLRGLPGTLHERGRRQFYGELARLLLPRRRLELWVLELQGKVVGAQFGLRYGTTVFSLQEGFDPDYAADSVGYVLRSQVLKNLIADGVRRYDFLGGADESKLRWGAKPGHYLDVSFARPFSAGSAYLRAQDYAGRSKSWLRRHLPRAAWEMLHKINVGVGQTGNQADSTKKDADEETVQDPK
jgi:CelD/BcsL family acetyltransferase involved in cellulose biosynthesis